MTALILGATSPIARALAHRYAEAGHAVFVGAREADEAAAIAADLRIRHQVPAAGAAFDATDFDGHEAFVARVEAELGAVEVAVVAFGDMGDPEAQGFDARRRVIDVNFTGAASISEAVTAPMAERGRGALVVLGSVAGDRGRQSNYVYGSAKGALHLYLGGLRNRLFARGVTVTTVKLGFIDTRLTFGMRTGIPIATPEAASRAIFAAQARGEDELYYPRFWAGIMGVIKGIPEGVFKRMSL